MILEEWGADAAAIGARTISTTDSTSRTAAPVSRRRTAGRCSTPATRPTTTAQGLDRITKQVVNAHDWAIGVTESDDGGARFEITGVQRVDA
ncbi:hypothetical protein EXE40_16370 [Halorubrum sp. GN11GM_10-3_MGM]|nr:hypothetical protein EXE40_16370 [Halorubrum sp. GN11GM_10-3_MGM]